MYALVLLGRRRCAGVICVAGAALGALQGVGCLPWCSWSRPLRRCELRGRRSTGALQGAECSWVAASVRVWQAQRLVLSKESDVCPGSSCAGVSCLAGAALPWCRLRQAQRAFAARPIVPILSDCAPGNDRRALTCPVLYEYRRDV